MTVKKLTLTGPFRQLLTLDNLPLKGPLHDEQLEVIENAGILTKGDHIEAVGPFRELQVLAGDVISLEGDWVVLPGLTDAHTHICWAGSRARDYALRLQGKSYLDIAQQGGGIWSTVTHTRNAGVEELTALTVNRAERLLHLGTTTIEVKSGYGLTAEAEQKMLDAIHEANGITGADLIPTCLAAHIKPRDFSGSAREYLDSMLRELLPSVKSRKLSNRVEIYVDEGAFDTADARHYLHAAKGLGFDVVVHADQFTRGGVQLAVEAGALSADHLEATTDQDIRLIADSSVIAVVLPGASMGLGVGFAPARKLLDAGASLTIASDWNPGSAPMGNLIMQAAVLGIFEKLTMAETLAAITCRAATALRLSDRGILRPGMLADFVAFPCGDYREILYSQGGLLPGMVWKKGERVKN